MIARSGHIMVLINDPMSDALIVDCYRGVLQPGLNLIRYNSNRGHITRNGASWYHVTAEAVTNGGNER